MIMDKMGALAGKVAALEMNDEKLPALENIPKQEFSQETVAGWFGWAYTIAGMVAVIFIIYGAVLYMTAQGDTSKIKTATRTLTFSIVGLLIVLLAAAATAFVMANIINAAEGAA